MKISLFVRNEIVEVTREIEKELSNYDFVIDNDNPDVVIYVGGDGTFLKAVQKYLPLIDKVKFFGIKTGRVGFFYDFTCEQIKDAFKYLFSNLDKTIDYPLLKCDVNYNTGKETYYAVNEARIEKVSHSIFCDVYIDNILFEKYRGSGLIVSTSAGSSAYNKNCGGAIVDNSINTLQLTEISGAHSEDIRPLSCSYVLSSNKTIEIKMVETSKAIFGFDSFEFNDKEILSFTVSSSDKVAKVISQESQMEKVRRCFIK